MMVVKVEREPIPGYFTAVAGGYKKALVGVVQGTAAHSNEAGWPGITEEMLKFYQAHANRRRKVRETAYREQ